MKGTHVSAVGEQSPLSVDRAARAADGAAAQLVALLRSGPDPGLDAVGRWTVRDVAAHVAGGAEIYAQMLRGTPSPAPTIEAIATLNDQIVAELGDQDLPALADRFEAAVADMLAAAGRHHGDPDLPWQAGLQMPLSTMLAVSCGEFLVHGYDIAHAAGARWPVRAGWARTVFLGALPVLPHYLLPERARGRPARFDIRLRGERAARAVFTVADGGLAIEAPAGWRADCYVSADPWAFLLVQYGRIGPLKPALTGQITAWGRRPWLGLKLPAMFRKP